MQTDFSIYSGMILTYLPLMILPLYASLVRLDVSIIEAAADLGAKKWDIPHIIVGGIYSCKQRIYIYK